MQCKTIRWMARVLPVVLLLDAGGVSRALEHQATAAELSLAVPLGTGSHGGGSGTQSDPCPISTVQQLQAMRNDLSAHYVLVNDIDASETATWDAGKGFSPVGDPAHPFTGTFDGRGHTISGLRIDRFGQITTHIALFGFTGEKALIRNVAVEKASVKGCDYVGILVGINQGTLSHCYVSGSVFGGGTFGGLVGSNSKGRISHCSAAVDVGPTGVGNHLGGLAGGNNGGSISDCFATGAVHGMENPGGLVGVNNEGVILRCYASGNVTSTFGGASDSYRRGAGGLVAANQGSGKISDCFATGKVTGPGGLPAGGLVGINMDKASVSNSYCRAIRGVDLPGVGKIYPDAGPAECEPVAEISADFFQYRRGPLDSWDFRRIWTLDESGTAAPLPRFESDYDLIRTTETTHGGGRTAEPGAKGTAVTVATRDGSRLEGRTRLESLAVATAYGKINIPLQRIRTVEFRDDRATVKIALNEGDTVSGVLDLEKFRFDTAAGALNIGVEHIARIMMHVGE